MTTLLQRMTMRARTPLSSVEPATRPLFAPIDQRSASASADARELSAVALAATPPLESWTRSARADERARVPRSDGAEHGLMEGAQRAHAVPSAHAAPSAQAAPQADAAPSPHADTAPPARGPLPAGAAHRGFGDERRRDPDVAEAPGGASARTDVAAEESSIGSAVPRAGAEPPASTPAVADVRPRQPARRTPAGVAEPAPAAATPEVTISIGHIDVRAPAPAAPAHSRPAFRPRVSLEDFLASRQGERP